MDKELLSKLKHIEVIKNEFLQPMWDNWYHYINNDKEEVKNMDISHKLFLENQSLEELVQMVLDNEELIKIKDSELREARLIIEERQNTIEILLSVIKYQNKLND